MGLETATYVSQLVVTNPVVGDPVKEGDDHLRLLKTVLQNTFPNSTKSLYFPSSVAEQTATVNVTAADAGKIYPVSADAASRTVNLPAAPPDGFEVTIVKVDASVNTVTVEPPGVVEINDELNIVLDTEFESARCIYMSTFGAWVAQRSAKGVPFDSDQEAAKVWPIANGGTGQITAGAAFDALSPTPDSEASAATLDLDVSTSSALFVTGTTTISAITLAAGRKRWVTFSGALTLEHSANLVLPTFDDIVTVAGDTALFLGEAGNVVRCIAYQRGSTGAPLALLPASQAEMEAATSLLTNVTPGRQHFHPGHPKAGGNLNGSGTPALRAGDYGLGAITDEGVGQYVFALDTAFNDTNFWITGWARSTSTRAAICFADSDGDKTSSSFQINTDIADSSAAPIDSTEIGVSFWGDYA